MNNPSPVQNYLREVRQTFASRRATEHSYRPALQELIQTLGGGAVRAINEPAPAKFGAPDLVVERLPSAGMVRDSESVARGTAMGHVECKKPGMDLERVENEEQLLRYRSGLPNLILTDYLEFRRYMHGELQETACLARIDNKRNIRGSRAASEQVVRIFESFLAFEPPYVDTPQELAKHMAAAARLLRDGIQEILKQEGEASTLHKQLEAYRQVLITDLSEERFADFQAQTAAYGLFAARCLSDPTEKFTRQSAVFTHTTPFLHDMLVRIAGPRIDPRLKWIMDTLELLLQRADMEAILKNFGSRTRREDPVAHFYEDFLNAYDPALRKKYGVYYTPEPVVSYIVRSVDQLLRKHFNLADGLADRAKIEAPAQDGKQREAPRVLILDPAAGTGTFLCNAVDVIRNTIVGEKKQGGGWQDYVQRHLLERLLGFEFLMAPYTICHLKLALEISGSDFKLKMPHNQRLGVFLTNTLEEAHETAVGPLFPHEIVHEANEAGTVKRDKLVMVVMGNPPYFGHSDNKGEWIQGLLRGQDGAKATHSYFHIDGQPLDERNPKWLNDDYVKFIRFAQWRIDRTGEGVLGFVTNHAYLDNPTFRGMRKSLMQSFDEIYLLDLHGNVQKKEKTPDGGKDENVFDIQQGVAIGLFVKKKDGGDAPARVFHADLWGRREDEKNGGKYGWLSAHDVCNTEWTELTPKAPLYLFTPYDETLAGEYEAGIKITDIFPVHSVGMVTARDKLTIQWTGEEMQKVASEFMQLPEEKARILYKLGQDVQDWKVPYAQQDLRSYHDAHTGKLPVTPIQYRPFDTRFTCYTGKSRGFICRPRSRVMRHMLEGENLGLITVRQVAEGVFNHAYMTDSITDFRVTLSNKGGAYLFPLYLHAQAEGDQAGKTRQVNLDPKFTEAAASALGLRFISEVGGGTITRHHSARRTRCTTFMPCFTVRSTAAVTPIF